MINHYSVIMKAHQYSILLVILVIYGTKGIITHQQCQQNKLCHTQKRDSCRLKMFSVARKRNVCWKKIVRVVYKYVLYWLGEFCVSCLVQKLKLVSINVINFCRNSTSYILRMSSRTVFIVIYKTFFVIECRSHFGRIARSL